MCCNLYCLILSSHSSTTHSTSVAILSGNVLHPTADRACADSNI